MKPTAVNIYLMQRKISQKEIAERIGIHTSTVSLLLSGTLILHKRLDQIAGLLGISRRKLNALIQENGQNGERDASD